MSTVRNVEQGKELPLHVSSVLFLLPEVFRKKRATIYIIIKPRGQVETTWAGNTTSVIDLNKIY